MASNLNKSEDDPAITAGEEENNAVNSSNGVAVSSSAEENMQEKTEKRDLLSTAQPMQEQEEEEGELEVGAQKAELCEGDGSLMDTDQQPELERHERSAPEKSKDCSDSPENTNEGTKNAKADEEEDSTVTERMEEGDSLQEKDSATCTDLQPKGKTSCDVAEKSAAEADKEGGACTDERSQVGSKHSLNPNCEGGGGSASSSSNSDQTQHHSADFLNALNLFPRKRPSEEYTDAESSGSDSTKRTRATNQNGDEPFDFVATVTPTLTQLFKKEPDSVVQLLAAAIPMDSLSSLLKEEHRKSSAQLKQLKERLEKAHQTVELCSQQKQPLLEQIDAVTEKIQLKQKQLKDTREDLRRLSAQESEIKARRDTVHSKCSELRRKLLASREALLQIQQLYANKRHAASKAVKAS